MNLTESLMKMAKVKKRTYIPDFLIGEKIYEVKGVPKFDKFLEYKKSSVEREGLEFILVDDIKPIKEELTKYGVDARALEKAIISYYNTNKDVYEYDIEKLKHNDIRKPGNNKMEEIVPKIIRYVWFDANESHDKAVLPRLYQECIKSSKVFNPDYRVVVHSNKPLDYDTLSPLLVENEIIPQRFIDDIDKLGIEVIAHKSDYVRYSLLLEEGGVYSDTDMIVIKSLDGLLGEKLVLAKEKPTTYCCAFMVAAPGSEVIKRVLECYHEDYRGYEWIYNSQKKLTQFANEMPTEVKLLGHPDGFFYPNYKCLQLNQLYDDYEINCKEDIYKKFDGYSHHIWCSTKVGNRLRHSLDEWVEKSGKDCWLPNDIYITQLFMYIDREYNKLLEA